MPEDEIIDLDEPVDFSRSLEGIDLEKAKDRLSVRSQEELLQKKRPVFARLKWLMIPALIGLSFYLWVSYHDSHFVRDNFVKFTGVKEFVLKSEYYDNHQCYIETTISSSEKRILLSKFKFENTLEKLKGRVEPSFISESPDYIYYFTDDGFPIYGYILFALEKNGNTLKVFEIYGG